ncbi:MAG: hypothetical protein JXB13_16440 [Phycisphaerae bacterium]|nr:hypothetical protein [Phycisphaerae bacterium]
MRRWNQIGIALLFIVNTVVAQEPDWPALPVTPHTDLQAVDGIGFGTFALTDPIRVQGVLLNRPQDMLDPTAAAPAYMGGTWQVFLQADDAGDFGGTALWMGQYIGRMSGNHPAGSYTDAEWVSELDRITIDDGTGRRLRPGDRVEIRARAPGLFFRGKTNINEQHIKAPEQDFDVVLLGPAVGLPAPTVITLSDVKDAADEFLFDSTRQTGTERYQGSLVEISGVSFVDPAGWGPGASLTLTDGAGRTLPVLLGRSRGFVEYAAPAGPFSIVGIFDQEDTDSGDGWMAGYRLWVMGFDGQAFIMPIQPGDTDGDGDVDLRDAAELQACYAGAGVPPAGALCDDFDMDFDGDVDDDDTGEVLTCLGGPDNPVACP